MFEENSILDIHQTRFRSSLSKKHTRQTDQTFHQTLYRKQMVCAGLKKRIEEGKTLTDFEIWCFSGRTCEKTREDHVNWYSKIPANITISYLLRYIKKNIYKKTLMQRKSNMLRPSRHTTSERCNVVSTSIQRRSDVWEGKGRNTSRVTWFEQKPNYSQKHLPRNSDLLCELCSHFRCC